MWHTPQLGTLTELSEDAEEENTDKGKQNASSCFSQSSWPKQCCLLIPGTSLAVVYIASSVLTCLAETKAWYFSVCIVWCVFMARTLGTSVISIEEFVEDVAIVSKLKDC